MMASSRMAVAATFALFLASPIFSQVPPASTASSPLRSTGPVESDEFQRLVDEDKRLSSISHCINVTSHQLQQDKIKLSTIVSISEYCNREVYVDSGLNDYAIRRQKFSEQDFSSKVILVMVVLITLSGIVLAAAQMFVSYKLASVGTEKFSAESNLVIESGRISLKSSITGLFILLISFLFFWLYVIRIHPLDEVELTKDKNASAAIRPNPTEAQASQDAGLTEASNSSSAVHDSNRDASDKKH